MNFPVLERHRRAVVVVLMMNEALMATWIATGDDPGVNYDAESQLAQAIANAEGEERVRCLQALTKGAWYAHETLVDLVDAQETEIAGLKSDGMEDREDARALVLKGWK